MRGGEGSHVPSRSYDPVLASSSQETVDMDICPEYMSDLVNFSDSLHEHLNRPEDTFTFPPLSGMVVDCGPQVSFPMEVEPSISKDGAVVVAASMAVA